MKEKKGKGTRKSKAKLSVVHNNPTEKSFAEELGIVDLGDPILASRGRLFSVAGPDHPVAEITEEYVVIHPQDKPYQQEDIAPSENIVFNMNDRGIILNEIGEPRKIPGARYNGYEVFVYWKLRAGTLFHFVVFFDQDDVPNFLTINGHRLTTKEAYKLRNMTHNGDLTHFPDIDFEPDDDP